MKGSQLTRSKFIKGASGTIACAAAAGLTGGVVYAKADEADAIAWEGEYDVIVAGAGLAGCAATITIAKEGDGATCLLVEKGEEPHGNSRYALGAVVYVDDVAESMVYLNELIGDATPADAIEALATGMSENLEWIKSLGAKDEWLRVTQPDPTGTSTMEYPELPNDNYMGFFSFNSDGDSPQHVFNFLFDIVTAQESVTYLPSTPLERLIQDPDDGTILGIQANGKNYRATRGVIVCTGGFEDDPEMLFTYTGVQGAKPYAGIGNTGDGIRACMKAGAGMWHMHGGAQYWMAVRDLANERFMSVVWNFTTKMHGITVGINGRRFYQDYDGCACPSPYAEPDSNLSLNVGYRHGVTQFGGSWTHLPLPPKGWFVFDQAGLEAGAIPADLTSDPEGDGWALKADSIEELAGLMEVPAEELAKTVNQWNAFCDTGEDLAFYRPADTLTPIKTAPFYAMLCVPAMLNTDGGPIRSAAGEVLDPYNEPIPHLYSAGEMGSLWGHFYQGAGNLSECLAFGRISARSALSNQIG